MKRFSERLRHMDPRTDHQAMVFLLSAHCFHWDLERAMELALFRTYASPRIARLLQRTGEFARRPRKRYDDTELILYELIEHGYDSPRGRRALRRMNQMHGRFTITNDDLLYVLSTFIFEPPRWLERYGWRPLMEPERLAFFHFYREVGQRMGIRGIPSDYGEFQAFNRNYETTHFHFDPANRAVADATLDLVLGMYLPRPLFVLGRPVLYALMDPPLLSAFGYPATPTWWRRLIRGTLALRGRLSRWLPEPRKPRLGTQRRRRTYPEGYEIEELGTFPQPAGSHGDPPSITRPPGP